MGEARRKKLAKMNSGLYDDYTPSTNEIEQYIYRYAHRPLHWRLVKMWASVKRLFNKTIGRKEYTK